MTTDVERIRDTVSLSGTVERFGYKLDRNGDEWEACCPFHAEDTASFTVFHGHDGVQRFHCFGCGAKGDVLDFVREVKGCSLPEAIRIIDGDDARPNVKPKIIKAANPYDGIKPLDASLEPPLQAGQFVRLYNPKRKGQRSEWGGFAPSLVFPYRRLDGSLVGYVLRHELSDGGKETPMVMAVELPDGRRAWSRFPFPKPRPLYGLQDLGDARQVIVVEGEKCRDYYRRVTGRCVVSWPGGTQGVRHADWSPLYGRGVIIIPDHDEAGHATANTIAADLHEHGSTVRIAGNAPGGEAIGATRYTFADFQAGSTPLKGWDVADAVDDGWTKQELDDFVRLTARAWTPAAEEAEASPPAAVTEPAPAASFPAVIETAPPAPPAGKEPPVGVAGLAKMPEWFSAQALGSEVWLARVFLEKLEKRCGGPVVRADGAFWAYGPTAWQPFDDDRLRLATHALDGVGIGEKETPLKLGSRMIDGILREMGTKAARSDFFNSPTLGVNTLNCTVTIDGDGKVEQRSHDPDDRFRFTVQAEYNLHTESEPPPGSLLHTLLTGVFRDDPDRADKIHLISEMLGAAAFGMATRVKQPKAFVFLGETASNGKSTVAALFRALLPEGSVSSIAPAFFGDEKRIVGLMGKAANVADELSGAAIAGEEFKAAVTGNPIEGRLLYKNVVGFTPTALHCFTTNVLPRFSGGIDRGLRRRLVVLPFNRTIPESEIIPDIVERIKAEELELLLGFAIAGAQRLKKRGAYTIPRSAVDALDDWLRSDPLIAWFESRIITVGLDAEPVGGWPRSSRLYQDFKAWAIDEGFKDSYLPAVNTFGSKLKALPGVVVKHTKAGSVAQGIKLDAGQGEVF